MKFCIIVEVGVLSTTPAPKFDFVFAESVK
jgi:hypothetical protein